MKRIEVITKELQPIREKLLSHKLYNQISTVQDVQVFMEHHVYAVWDFMSLLKSLQIQLTTVNVPWVPAEDTKVSRFINEIVLGEESDVNEVGEPMSHYEMYIEAMNEVGAKTFLIEDLVNEIRKGDSIEEGLHKLQIVEEVKDFVRFTFEVIALKKPHVTAAVFTFGREDLIPDLFLGIVKNLEKNSDTSLKKLIYYLERHIELDGDEHGPLSLKMVEGLCDEDQKWDEALHYSLLALQKRIRLWDTISNALVQKDTILS
ncbi:MAG: heme oxygenase [Aquimarina sp.]|nr:heme oxygenase [Aquimarina sp.]